MGLLNPSSLTFSLMACAPNLNNCWMLQLGEKIKLKTPEEVMELIENMAANDHAILHDRTHISTKRSLLELTSQDALLAHVIP